MADKGNIAALLDMIFENSSEFYNKDGKRFVNDFNVKDFVIQLNKNYKLSKR